MKLVYVSGPYNAPTPAGIDAHIAHARRVAIDLWEHGFAVLCPHLNTAHMEVDCRCTWQQYIDGDLCMVERCDAVLMLAGWENSKGATLERIHALRRQIPVWYENELPLVYARYV